MISMVLHHSSQALTRMRVNRLEQVPVDFKVSKVLVVLVLELVVVAKQTFLNNSSAVHSGAGAGVLVLGRVYEGMTLKQVWE